MKSLALYTSKALEFLVVIILSTMACLVFLNVVLRYGFNSSINITEEVSRYLFVWLTFLGAILAFSDNQHVSVTMLTDKLSPTTLHILRLFTDSIMLFCSYLVLQGGWVQFQLNLHNLSPISEIPTGVTYLAAVISGVFIAILIATRVISTAAILIRGETK
ncbi:TRAP transporter small permease [Glaesserella parasuis]|nr:TRAP transporter small permease [Glaesserella parasuis]MCT8769765.1 TRAP transporter small permease [Glaesserella parasuis]MDE3964212.1 TRAP transporter small permease [Glaesserella parasuis]MDP0333177.1 TRAP transporter small permease [Glaesserella parasuis]MDP0404297.1 TRAP transporter small permease [Glaesserella parasuis]